MGLFKLASIVKTVTYIFYAFT